MKKQFAAFVLVLGMLLPVVGNAQAVYRDSGPAALGGTKVYLGVKYGVMITEPDISGSEDFQMDNMGVVFGGHINDWLALELDYSQTVSADKQDFQGTDVKFETDTLGLFLARSMDVPSWVT
jgi:opacity protein-like surface antigen